MSARGCGRRATSPFFVSSGAIQAMEPPIGRSLPDSTRERPKSTSFALACPPGPPPGSTRMLLGLRSPCTIAGRWPCKCCKARAMPKVTTNLSASVGAGCCRVVASHSMLSMYASSDGPLTSSSTSDTSRVWASTMAPKNIATFGCRTWRSARNSASAEVKRPAWLPRLRIGIFTATLSPKCEPRTTTPCRPRPSTCLGATSTSAGSKSQCSCFPICARRSKAGPAPALVMLCSKR
mmetsp:Transcript_48048/g.138387  ORF Transcript_48048/g.138387 Transcript_48048/m.138387 type:complete len:236 (+) Transcript_48048:45-752(+)